MTADTVHLIAQLIRHQRGMMTALEKWISKQPPSQTHVELVAVTTLMREVLTSYESQISKVDTVAVVEQ